MDVSPDGGHVAVTFNPWVRAFELGSTKNLFEVKPSTEPTGPFLRYSPDGQRLAVAAGPNTVRLYEARTGKELAVLPNDQRGIPVSLSFSPDGYRLAVCGRSAVEVWDVRDLKEGLVLRGDGGALLDLAFAAGGRQLVGVTATEPPAVDTGDTVPDLAGVFGSAAGVGGAFGGLFPQRDIGGWIFGPEGIARVGPAPSRPTGPTWEVKRWDLDGGRVLATLPGQAAPLKCAALDPDAARVAVGASDDTLHVCDTHTGREITSVLLPGPPMRLALGRDVLAVVVREAKFSQIEIRDAASGRAGARSCRTAMSPGWSSARTGTAWPAPLGPWTWD